MTEYDSLDKWVHLIFGSQAVGLKIAEAGDEYYQDLRDALSRLFTPLMSKSYEHKFWLRGKTAFRPITPVTVDYVTMITKIEFYVHT